MTRYRPTLLLGIASVIALVTSLLIYRFLTQVKTEHLPVHAETKNVAVATINLSGGTRLTPEMAQVIPYPSEYMPEGYFDTTERLAGRILLTNLKTNEPVLESKLAPIHLETGGIAAVTDPQKRAMAVKVDEVVGVAGFVKPGDRVDVMVTMSQQRDKSQEQFSKTVLENILVLATGADVIRKGKDQEPSVVKVITLEVTPEEAEKLALAASEGNLRLALRNPLNQTTVLTKGVTVGTLLSSYLMKDNHEPVVPKRPLPRKEEQNKIQVQIIKGGTVKNVILE